MSNSLLFVYGHVEFPDHDAGPELLMSNSLLFVFGDVVDEFLQVALPNMDDEIVRLLVFA